MEAIKSDLLLNQLIGGREEKRDGVFVFMKWEEVEELATALNALGIDITDLSDPDDIHTPLHILLSEILHAYVQK